MRYLRKFNEELRSETYTRAARLLNKKGHKKRSDKLHDHAKNIRWKEMIEIYKNFGEFELSHKVVDPKNRVEDIITGKFYMGLEFMDDPTIESLIESKNESSDFKIYFFCFLIPKDQETKDKFNDSIDDLTSGFYVGPYPTLSYKVVDGTLNFDKLYLENAENEFIFSRRAAVVLKKQLLYCFENVKYPTIENPLFEMIRNTLQSEDFTLEFDYDMDDIYKDIESISINDLYTD
jgi:hypothetical protein